MFTNKKMPRCYIGMGIVFLLFFPIVCQSLEAYYPIHIAGLVGVYVILALGLNLVLGFTGQLDLGFMAFYAIGAYTAAILSIKGWSFWLILPLGALLTIGFRLLLGLPALRLRGDYLAIVTLGFSEITRLVLNNWDRFTNGPKGLPRVGETISVPQFFNLSLQTDLTFYYLILLFVILSIIVSIRLDNSRIGRAWIALREDEIAAELVGVDVRRIRLLAFAFSALFASLAGTLYVHWIRFVSPESFTFWESVLLVSMVVLGGMGSVPGIFFGTLLIVAVPEVLRTFLGSRFVDYRMLIFGAGLVLFIIFRPQGLIPSKRRSRELHPEDEWIRREEDQSLFDFAKRE